MVMNVFVVSSGRTATTTFVRACHHLDGVTAGHESRASSDIESRVDYPSNHIEADNRLLFFLHQLEDRYGSDAYYVYVERDRGKIAASYDVRWHLTVSIARAFTHGVRMIPRVHSEEVQRRCEDFAYYADETFRIFLARQKNVMFFNLEEAKASFETFLSWIGVEDVSGKAMAEWDVFHNRNTRNDVLKRLKRAVRVRFP